MQRLKSHSLDPMMRRTFFIIGLLLLLALPRADAQQTPTGLSTYVQRVLERAANAEKEIASKGHATSGDASFQKNWYDITTSTITETLDPKVMRALTVSDFSHATACLSTDETLLEAEMQKVSDLLKKANSQGNVDAANLLNPLYKFLSDRYGILVWGATHQGYTDPGWASPQTFDSAATTKKIQNEKLCPFDTAYLDLSADGASGCTPDMIDKAISMLPANNTDLKDSMEKEKEALQALLDKTQGWRPAALSTQWEGCTPPDEAKKQSTTWSQGYFWEISGREFTTLLHLLWNKELLRPSPYTSIGFIGMQVLNQELNRETRSFSTAQTKADATIESGIVDAKQIEKTFVPLTGTIGALSRLAHDYGTGSRSLRDMVMDFDYFLRRSCMNRSCNARLDHILTILPKDACFPYTTGSGDLAQNATADEVKQKVQELQSACD